MDPTTGPTGVRRIAGRYRLEAVLGRGGMGVVWAAQDELLNRPVAIKEVLTAPGLSDEQVAEARRRTLHEARTAARLSSPAAVLVFDVVEQDGEPWVVMERLAPRTLADVLDDRGPLPPPEVATLGLRLLDALDAAHAAGVLHRDVKPGNVMFRGEPDMRNAVLTDFGIARLVGDATTTATGMIIGSPAFVAPERARGEGASPASDLWGLGVTLWIAAEGVSPFARDGALQTLTAVLTAEPPALRSAGPLEPALTGLLRKDPEERLDSWRLRTLLTRVEVARAATSSEADETQTLSSRPDGRRNDADRFLLAADDEDVAAAPADDGGERRGRTALVAGVLALALVGALGAALAGLRGGPSASPSGSAASAGTSAATRSPTPATTTSATGRTRTATRSAASAPAPEPSSQPTSEPTSSPAPTDSATTRRATSRSPSSTTRTSTASASATSPSSGGAVPAGLRRYTDPTGFSVAVPEAWRVERRGQRVYLRDPGSSAYLLVDQTTAPAADPVADWQSQERAVSRRLPGYRLIRIDPVTIGEWRGADWEFTHGRGTHVLNRNLVTGADQAYALYWSAPDRGWERSLRQFRRVMETFQPRQ